MVSPRYSITCPVPPDTPSRPMIVRMRSLAVTPAPSPPLTFTASVVACAAAGTASRARGRLRWCRCEGEGADGAVRAGVAVAAHDGLARLRESSSGPMMCTMPRWLWVRPSSSTPNSAQLASSSRTCRAAESSAIGAPPNTWAVRVGVEWSMVASVRSGVVRAGRARAAPRRPAGGDLVDQVQVDVEHRRGVRALGAHLVTPPHLVEQGLRPARHDSDRRGRLQPEAATRGADMST